MIRIQLTSGKKMLGADTAEFTDTNESKKIWE